MSVRRGEKVQTPRLIVAAATTSLALAGLMVVPAHAANRPDLVIGKVTKPPSSIAPGQSMPLRTVVKNIGSKRSKSFKVRFVLSKDTRSSKGDTRLATRRVKAIPPQGSRKISTRVEVPATTAKGRYHVLACADATRRVREAREGNNCRASRTKVRVKAATSAAPTLPATPAPLDVQFEVDPGAAVSRERLSYNVTPVVAEGADGTRYELTVPPGALASPIDLTMTPVTSISGAPLVGTARAVELEPHGITFAEPVTLTITPPAGTDLTRASGFMFDAGGLDFHAYPATFDDTSVTLQLMHFSSAGIGQPADGAVTAGKGRWPRRGSAQLQMAAAELLGQARRDQLEGRPTDPTIDERLEGLAQEYEENVVRPLLEAGLQCGNFEQARRGSVEAAGLARMGQLYSGESWASAETEQLMRDAWEAQVECLVDACVDEHRVGAVWQLWGMARHYALLGDEVLGQAAWDRADRCLRFELQVESSYSRTQSWRDNAPAGSGGLFYYDWDESGAWSGGTTIDLSMDLFRGLQGQGETGLGTFDYTASYRDVDAPENNYDKVGSQWAPGVSSAQVQVDLNQYLPVWAEGWNPPTPFTHNHVSLSLDDNYFAALADPAAAVMRPLEETYVRSGSSPGTSMSSTWVQESEFSLREMQEPWGGVPSLLFGAAEQQGAVFFERSFSDGPEWECAAPDAEIACTKSHQMTVRLVHTPER